MSVCPDCGTELVAVTGIGEYCPNDDCDRTDDVSTDGRNITWPSGGDHRNATCPACGYGNETRSPTKKMYCRNDDCRVRGFYTE